MLTTLGRDGLAARAQQSRTLAEDLHDRLLELGWEPRRHQHAMTVTLAAPSHALCARYGLTVVDGRSHLVCVPGITSSYIDELLIALSAKVTGGHGGSVADPPPWHSTVVDPAA